VHSKTIPSDLCYCSYSAWQFHQLSSNCCPSLMCGTLTTEQYWVYYVGHFVRHSYNKSWRRNDRSDFTRIEMSWLHQIMKLCSPSAIFYHRSPMLIRLTPSFSAHLLEVTSLSISCYIASLKSGRTFEKSQHTRRLFWKTVSVCRRWCTLWDQHHVTTVI